MFNKKRKFITLFISIFVIFIVTTVFLTVVANQDDNDISIPSQTKDEAKSFEKSNISNEVTAPESYKPDSSDNSVFFDYTAREGATQEEADRTTLTTDKTLYNVDEKITVTIKSLYKDDLLGYGDDYIVQYYDSATGEWKNSEKLYFTKDIAINARGIGTFSFKLTDRSDNIADKYRIILQVFVNGYLENLISNEFSVQFE